MKTFPLNIIPLNSKVCPQCYWALKQPPNPNAIGAPATFLCMRFPPTPIAVGAGSGGVAVVPMYPPVNAATQSCGEFTADSQRKGQIE